MRYLYATKKGLAFIIFFLISQTLHAELSFSTLSNNLNINANSNSDVADVAYTQGGLQTVVWVEAGNVYVKQQNKLGQWVTLGSSLNQYTNGNARSPDIAIEGNTVYVTWSESTEDLPGERIYVKRWNGKSWTFLGAGNLNAYFFGIGTAEKPTIAVYQSTVYVAWVEQGHLFSKWWNGNQWQFVAGNGNPLNVIYDQAASQPDITYALNGSQVRIYLTWSEYNPYFGARHVRVRYWQQGLGDWQWLDPILNNHLSQTATSPSIAVATVNGQYHPYVAFYEYVDTYDSNIVIKRYENSQWVEFGSGLEVTSTLASLTPSLALHQNRPVVAWTEHEQITPIPPFIIFPGVTQDIYVAIWDNDTTAWEYSSDLKRHNDQLAVTGLVRLAVHDGQALVTWVEANVDEENAPFQTVVKEGNLPTEFGVVLK